jgi:hypothetical protein
MVFGVRGLAGYKGRAYRDWSTRQRPFHCMAFKVLIIIIQEMIQQTKKQSDFAAGKLIRIGILVLWA